MFTMFLLLAASAFAEDAEPGTTWSQIGSVVGVVVASAVASGISVLGAGKLGKQPGEQAPEGFYSRIDERTAGMQKNMGTMNRKINKHGNVLLILTSKVGTTPEEDKALEALKDDSEEDDA